MLVNQSNVFCNFDFLQKNKLMFKFRGSSKRTNLIEVGRDIMASNGIIHIVTKLMTHEPNILGDPNVSFAFSFRLMVRFGGSFVVLFGCIV